MKNIIALTFLFCLLATTQISAQHFGLRAGLNATNAKFDVGSVEIDTEGQTNLLLGAFVTIPLAGEVLVIQPEVTYLNRGFEVTDGFFGSEINLAYLDLGALVRLNFGSDEGLGFYVGAGPYVTYAVSGKTTDIGGTEQDIDFDADRVKRSGLQFAGVGGLTFGSTLKFFVEARYMGSLSNLSDEDDIDIKQNSIGINGGVMVPLGF